MGKKYKVPICFIYHINPMGKIDLMREYLDVVSVMAQFKERAQLFDEVFDYQ